MTKKEKEDLVWRLKELPSAEGVARLVEQGVITADQARDILFSKPVEKNPDEENKALKEQVKFLQDMVERLINQRGSHFTPYHYTVRTPSVYWTNLTTSGNTRGLSYDYDSDSRTLTMSVNK